MNKLTVTLVSIAILISQGLIWYFSHKKGFEDGINAYHQHCYQVGGIAINSAGDAVVCKGLTQTEEPSLKGKSVASSLFE